MRYSKFFNYKKTHKRHFIICGSKDKKNVICVKCPDLECNKSLTNKELLKLHLEINHGCNDGNNKKDLQLSMVSVITVF